VLVPGLTLEVHIVHTVSTLEGHLGASGFTGIALTNGSASADKIGSYASYRL